MSVKFDLGNGTETTFADNSQLVKTQRGKVPADQVVQGDMILFITGHDMATVMSPPVVT